MKKIANINGEIHSSRLKCQLESSQSLLFFTLVDYRNQLFTSDDPEKILEFYNGFENRDQLIRWMKERPKGVHTIYEVDGDNDIIVVIPTADFNGKYALECRNNIFKGLHMIFVESGGRDDFYFNIAHNVNIGVKRAMEYNPKWIVFSGDDMYKKDDIGTLVNKLSALNPEELKTVFTKEATYHSLKVSTGIERRFIGRLGYLYSIKNRQLNRDLVIRKVRKRFHAKWLPQATGNKLFSMILLKNRHFYILNAAFSILSGNWCRKVGGDIYNECYVNGCEDIEQSIVLTRDISDYSFIDFKIGDLIGSTFGNGEKRHFRDICNQVYFDSRIENILNTEKMTREYGILP